MTLGLDIRFRNKKKTLAEIRKAMTRLSGAGALKENELVTLVDFLKEKLIRANNSSSFDLALNSFFEQFPMFSYVEKTERRDRIEILEQGVSKALMDGEDMSYLKPLENLDAGDEQAVFAWAQKLSPWQQSRVYDFLANS